MPTYEFRCNDTGKRFEVFFKTIAAYETATIKSPYTNSGNVSRLIRKVNVKKSGGINMDALMSGDETALDALENADPQTVGYNLKAMAEQSGEDLGGEFNEIVNRLEAGESPDEIESSLLD